MNRQHIIFATLFAFLCIASPTAQMKGAVQDQPASAGVQEIQVTAKKYEFSLDPIRVKKGQPVKLIVTATDRDHGIEIDDFHIKQKLKKGQAATIEFTPDKAGTFPFKCWVHCGLGHGRMKGTLVVEE